MPRKPTWGTPGRSEHFPKLRGLYLLFIPAVLLGIVVFVMLGAFQTIGVRGPLSPGDVTSAHAVYDTRCEACHVSRAGAVSVRCQRCHDTGGAARLTQSAHVLFGSGSVTKSGATEDLQCARCHVEHRGSQARLADVEEGQCLRCHASWRPASEGLAYRIASFAGHPEFKVLRDNQQGNPRLLFSHKAHMKPMLKEGAAGEWETCTRCHAPEREAAARDLEPISFEQHCLRCHGDELAMQPVPLKDVQETVEVRDAGGAFQKTPDGQITKTGVRHRDPWILFNMRKLQWELYPEEYARDRAAVFGRMSQLQRRIAQAEPLAGIDVEALKQREAGLVEELRRLESRTSQKRVANDAAGLARLQEVAAAALAAADPDAQKRAAEIKNEAQPLEGKTVAPEALSVDEFEARRRELLAVLDALGAADPSRARTVDDLRRRVLALVPGEPAGATLQRAVKQRRDDLARVHDEIQLRAAGAGVESRVLPERLALQLDLQRQTEQAQSYFSFTGLPPALSDADRQRKQAALTALTGEGARERCAKCHAIVHGSLQPPRPARSVMVRAVFAHKKHLIAPLPQPGLVARIKATFRREPPSSSEEIQRRYRCAYCHEGIQKAADAPRKPSIPAVQSCRECHHAGATRQDCQICHRYHPPGVPS